MKLLPVEHALPQLIRENYTHGYSVFLKEETDGDIAIDHRRLYRHPEVTDADMVFGVVASFQHDNLGIIVMQDMRRLLQRSRRLQFVVCITHPETETRWGLGGHTEFTDTGKFERTHPQLPLGRIRIDYDDSAEVDRFKLSIVTMVAASTSMASKPLAFTPAQIDDLSMV